MDEVFFPEAKFRKWLNSLSLDTLRLINMELHIYLKKLEKDPTLTLDAFYEEIEKEMTEHEKTKLSA